MFEYDNPETMETAHRHFHSLCINPQVTFDSQHGDEKVLLVLRAHPVTFFPWLSFAAAAFLAPPFFNIMLSGFLNFPELLFVNVFFYSALFSYVFINFLLWTYNVGIVTSQRVIDIDYISVLQKEISGSSLDDITDITGKTTGFFRSLFDFGDLSVQTAGIMQNIEFAATPEPDVVVSIISQVSQDHKNSSLLKRKDNERT